MGKERKGEIKVCSACSKEFYVPQYRLEKAKFCSKDCQNHVQHERVTLSCKCCNKDFTVSDSRKDRNKFCSVECKTQTSKNEKERRKYLKTFEVLKRGKNSSRKLKTYVSRIKPLCCENCGYNKASYNIEIHHIDENPCNNELENLAVLCVMCHRDLHYGDLRLKDNKYYYENNG